MGRRGFAFHADSSIFYANTQDLQIGTCKICVFAYHPGNVQNLQIRAASEFK